MKTLLYFYHSRRSKLSPKSTLNASDEVIRL